jgi:hypothetical protein
VSVEKITNYVKYNFPQNNRLNKSKHNMNHLGGQNKAVVSYFYDDDIGNYQYNVGHPMKPFRVKMTDELIKVYGLD